MKAVEKSDKSVYLEVDYLGLGTHYITEQQPDLEEVTQDVCASTS